MAARKRKRSSSYYKSIFSSPYLVGSATVIVFLLVINLPVTVNQPSAQVKSSFQIAKGDSNSTGDSQSGTESTSGTDTTTSNSGTSGTSGSNMTTVGNTPALTTPKPAVSIRKVEDKTVENQLKTENELESSNDDLLEIKNSGGELHLSSKDKNGTDIEVENNSNSRKFKVKTATGEAEVELETEGSNIRLRVQGTLANSKFPLSFNKATGQLFVQTGNGAKEIRILPDEASSVVQTAGIVDKVDSIDLESSTVSLSFKIQGTKNLKLFGFIPFNENVTTHISGQDASIISTQEPLWARVFSFLFSS